MPLHPPPQPPISRAKNIQIIYIICSSLLHFPSYTLTTIQGLCSLHALPFLNPTSIRSHRSPATRIFVADLFPNRFFSTILRRFLQFLKVFQRFHQLRSTRPVLRFSRKTLHCKNCSSHGNIRRILTVDPLINDLKNPSFADQIRLNKIHEYLFIRWTILVYASSSRQNFKKNHPKTVDIASLSQVTFIQIHNLHQINTNKIDSHQNIPKIRSKIDYL